MKYILLYFLCVTNIIFTSEMEKRITIVNHLPAEIIAYNNILDGGKRYIEIAAAQFATLVLHKDTIKPSMKCALNIFPTKDIQFTVFENNENDENNKIIFGDYVHVARDEISVYVFQHNSRNLDPKLPIYLITKFDTTPFKGSDTTVFVHKALLGININKEQETVFYQKQENLTELRVPNAAQKIVFLSSSPKILSAYMSEDEDNPIIIATRPYENKILAKVLNKKFIEGLSHDSIQYKIFTTYVFIP
jgi:hypothetical protein